MPAINRLTHHDSISFQSQILPAAPPLTEKWTLFSIRQSQTKYEELHFGQNKSRRGKWTWSEVPVIWGWGYGELFEVAIVNLHYTIKPYFPRSLCWTNGLMLHARACSHMRTPTRAHTATSYCNTIHTLRYHAWNIVGSETCHGKVARRRCNREEELHNMLNSP